MDNSKLVRTLQDTLELNEQLRAQVSLLEETLCKQRAENDKLSSKRLAYCTELYNIII